MKNFINQPNLKTTDNRGALLTEQTNIKSIDLDILSTTELVSLFSTEDLIPQKAVANSISEIVIAIDLISKRMKSGGRLFYLGAGTSGRLGLLDAAECPPTFCSSPDLVQGILAGGTAAIENSSEGLEDIGSLGIDDLKARCFDGKDCLIGISAGGTTPYVRHALKYAKRINALVVSITCVPKDQINIECDVDIRLLTGPELLTGSTRLKAATATKMTLNIISTSVMIRLGKVYQNRMIDVSITNQKLLDRAIRILSEITNLKRKESLALLKKSNGSIKTAIVMHSLDINFEKANDILRKNNNNLREVIKFSKTKLPIRNH